MRQANIFYITAFLAFFLLACTNGLSVPAFMATATPSPVPVIDFEVTVIMRYTATPPVTPTASSFATMTPIPIFSDPTRQAQLLLSSPTFTPTAIPNPTVLLTPTLTSTVSPITPSATTTQTAQITEPAALTETSTAQDPSAPAGSIILLYPEDGMVMASSTHGAEFKWDWQGDPTLKRCDSIEGYGFELRIWPAQDGFGPLGAMDAAKNKEDGFLGCNLETGIRSYLLEYLQSKPGVKAAGAGKFLWDVTLVRLDPYQPVIITNPRIFEISFDYYGPLDPFGEKLSCTDFNSWAEAQAVFLIAGGLAKDPHELDPDGDGFVCDELRE